MVGCPERPTGVGRLIRTASNWLQLTLQYSSSTLDALNTNLPYGYLAQRQEFVGVLLDDPGSFGEGTLCVTVTSGGMQCW